jgi:HPt (histidine-containing phosphotransfer) domain-containing protein
VPEETPIPSEYPPADSAVLDINVALVRLGGNTELLAKLVRYYFEDSNRLMLQLREAAVKRDVAVIERTAHTLKSLAANFEARAASRAALRVEESAQTGDLAAAVECIPQLEFQIKRLDTALLNYGAADSAT